MQTRSRPEIYRAFIDFVVHDFQSERRATNRRMASVLIWCFIAPALASAALLLLVKIQVLGVESKIYLEWLALIFPVAYGLYILGAEVITEIPGAYRRGGIATTLDQAAKENEWREKTGDSMKKAVETGPMDWEWVAMNFRMDLEKLQNRNKYLTALGGVVFFLIMQGIDVLGEGSRDHSQWVGLVLFLTLFYLAGNQTYHALLRYLNCAELISKRP